MIGNTLLNKLDQKESLVGMSIDQLIQTIEQYALYHSSNAKSGKCLG